MPAAAQTDTHFIQAHRMRPAEEIPSPPPALIEALGNFDKIAQDLALALQLSQIRALDLEVILTTCLVTIATDPRLATTAGAKIKSVLTKFPRRRFGDQDANSTGLDGKILDCALAILEAPDAQPAVRCSQRSPSS